MNQREHKENKQKTAITLKKANGTLQKITKMVEEDVYCPEIIQQIDSVIGLLHSAKKTLLRGHLYHCLVENMSRDKKLAINELIKIFDLK